MGKKKKVKEHMNVGNRGWIWEVWGDSKYNQNALQERVCVFVCVPRAPMCWYEKVLVGQWQGVHMSTCTWIWLVILNNWPQRIWYFHLWILHLYFYLILPNAWHKWHNVKLHLSGCFLQVSGHLSSEKIK